MVPPRSPASLFDMRCSAWEPLAGRQCPQQGGWEARPRAELTRVSVASEGGGRSEKTVSEVCEEQVPRAPRCCGAAEGLRQNGELPPGRGG